MTTTSQIEIAYRSSMPYDRGAGGAKTRSGTDAKEALRHVM